MQTSAHPHTFTLPALAEGERYAGIVIDLDNGQPTHHLILLPQQPASRLPWDEAIDWAAAVGAKLPTRQEADLLQANLKLAFESEWHWTCEQYAYDDADAWLQDFVEGDQCVAGKGYEGRARAIRREPIAEGK